MPELPEVEAVVRRLRAEAVGSKITGVTVFRARAIRPQKPEDLQPAIGHTIERFERRGKNIAVWLDDAKALRVHLGMTGNLLVIPDARFHSALVRVLFTLKDGRGLVLQDLRLFGSVQLYTPDELKKRLADIGVDPLKKAFTPDFFLGVTRASEKPAKLFLMEQKPISGLGNIYSAEALFRAKIHPAKPLGSVRKPKLLALYQAIPEVLREAVKHTVHAYRTPGFFKQRNFFVYGRKGEPCRVCGKAIQVIEQGGRSTYFCPGCQR